MMNLIIGIILGIAIVLACAVVCAGREPAIGHGHQPNTPPRDWSKVNTEGIRSGAQPPRKTGLIPGRPGQSINEGPGTWIPPMRSTHKPRPEDS